MVFQLLALDVFVAEYPLMFLGFSSVAGFLIHGRDIHAYRQSSAA